MKSHFAGICLVGCVGSLISSAAGCSSSSSTNQTTTTDSADASVTSDVEIGVLLSTTLTTGVAPGLQKALDVATQQINQVGILGGRKINFVVANDQADKTVVVDAANQLLARGVPAILGPSQSGVALAAQPIISAKHVVEISATATSPLLTMPTSSSYFFRTAPVDDFQGRAISKFLIDGVPALSGGGKLGGSCMKVSIVNADDTYGTGLAAVIQSIFAARGGTVATQDKVPGRAAADYTQIVKNIVAAQPDCMALIVYQEVGAKFLRAFNDGKAADTSGHDWSKFFVSGSDGEYSSTAFVTTGQSNPADPTSPNSTEGCYGTTPDPAPDTPEYQAFRNLWQQSYPGTEPAAFAANEYDAAMTLALAIEHAGDATDGTKIRDALYAVTDPGTTADPARAFGPDRFLEAIDVIHKGIKAKYVGASGPLTFDANGNVMGNYILWHVEKKADGTFGFTTVGKIKASDLQ